MLHIRRNNEWKKLHTIKVIFRENYVSKKAI